MKYLVRNKPIVTIEETVTLSFAQINSLWELYCSDPNFSIQCELNHD